MLKWILHLEKRFWQTSDRLPQFLLKLLRVTALVIRGWVAERPMLRAAALTYTTTLTLIPTLAMVFGVLNFLNPAQKYEQDILLKLSSFMTPESARQVHEVILQSIQNINSGGLAGFSLVLVLAGALVLISNTEQAFNHIWGIHKLRPLKQRFVTYLAMVITGPVAILVPLTLLSAKNLGFLDAIPLIGPFIQSTLAAILPLIVIWTFLFVLYYAVPNINVSISSALVGSFVASIFFSGNQIIAVTLLSRFQTFNTIYGSLATVPIFLVGVFVAWVVILSGAQIAYAWQNVESFRREYLLESVSGGDEEMIALRLMHRLAFNFIQKGEPLDYIKASHEWELPSRLLRNLLDRLETAGFVYRIGEKERQYLPGKELDKICLLDVISAIRLGAKGFRPLEKGSQAREISQLYQEFALKKEDLASQTLKNLILKGVSNG